ncbi:unnamed protein product [Rodentolepis nana]|uniref:Adenosine 3'-phospho 5'-phosphosulfate transporter 2 n=1 Tax=Rodentolepis nana TaxID=102285 RepID=A0A0R3TBS6_RODNA|nr:unnamed protein product [Rodentolepis nana]
MCQHVDSTEAIPSFVAISIALICDGYIGNLQEMAMKRHNIPALQILTYSYAFGFGLMVLIILFTGAFPTSTVLFQDFGSTFVWSTLFALSGYLGLQFVLLLVNHFGALLAVTVTTLRKAVTIVLSFLLFQKPFSVEYIWSGGLVVIGVLLSTYSKSHSSKAKAKEEAKELEKKEDYQIV